MAGVDVVIPAGGTIDEAFSRVVGVKSKTLIKFGDKTILRTTIEALRGAPEVGRIVVVGTPEVVAHEDAKLADAVLPEAGSSPKNIWAATQHLQGLNFPPDRVLIVTSDMPYLQSSSISRFFGLCDHSVDFNVSLVAKDDYEEEFPGATATFVRLLDGHWTTGGVFLITTRGLKVALDHIESVFARRKSKLGMARLLGLKFVWDYANKKLTVSDVERKVMGILNVRGRAVPGSPAELAYDIDYIDDYQYVVSSRKGPMVKPAPAPAAQPSAPDQNTPVQ